MELKEAEKFLNEKGYILEKALPKYKQFELHCEERFKEISDQFKEILIKEYNLNPKLFQTAISGSFCTISIKWRFIIVKLSIEENGKKLYITNYITERQKVFDIKMLDSEDIPRIVLDAITQSRLSKLIAEG